MTRKTTTYARNRRTTARKGPAGTMHPIRASAAFTVAESTEQKLRLHSAVESLRTGKMTIDEYDYCAVVLNAVRVLADDISPDLSDMMDSGMAAMRRVRDRYDDGKPLALDGLGLQAMPDLLEVFDAIIEKISPLQMQNAVVKSYENITKRKLKWK